MEILFTILYVVVCLALNLVVLLQSGKAGDLAATFGGVSSQTALGSRGMANWLSKTTSICATLFLGLALFLAILSSMTTGSRLEEVEDLESPAPVEAPAEPETSDGEAGSATLPPGDAVPATDPGDGDVPATGDDGATDDGS